LKVLFMCTANSCRSQMAETWARRLFPADWEVHSAGLLTYPIVDKTRFTMQEVGLEMTGQETKTMDTFDLDSFDLIVTLSREAGNFLPRLADPARHVKRPIDDPMSCSGDGETKRAAFRQGREEVRRIVQAVAEGRLGPGS